MAAPKSRLKWFIDSFDRGTGLVVDRLCLGAAVAAVAAALLVVAAQVVFRYGLNDSLIWAEEFARFALIWAAFLGVPVAYRRGEHVGVTLLIENLPAVFARVLIFLTHILAGDRVANISKRLNISQHTVRNHLKSIFRKTGTSSQAELVPWARSLE